MQYLPSSWHHGIMAGPLRDLLQSVSRVILSFCLGGGREGIVRFYHLGGLLLLGVLLPFSSAAQQSDSASATMEEDDGRT